MITFLFVFFTIYCATFFTLYLACFKIKTISENQEQIIKFSILIPFRNESKNLPKLLASIHQIDYDISKFEVILIDDNELKMPINFSNYNFNKTIICNYRTTNSPKKDAITLGVNLAKFQHIVTVDADCEVPKNWLQNYNDYLLQNTDKELVIGQVQIKNSNSFLHIFQSLEFDVLQAITMGSYAINQVFMCNGANLCYNKNIFFEVNGYHGNTHIASGDDVFLLQKVMLKNSKYVGYCKHNDKVTTKPVNTWTSLFNQRLRWASKTSAYQSFFAKYIAILVLLSQLISILIIGYLLINNFNILLFNFLVFKYFIHVLLLFKIQIFSFKILILSILFEIYYVIFSIIIAFSSVLKLKTDWK
jgi:cellulose synthase/poly-beta-1,6-N-acetylglucosamine synthase-like glycosyltransferase